ncbi:MAG: type II toxin-antitoxin system VapC family toxin [Burkholderiales bacterium]|nr:type II toxin-antitoxin system VapC family toxin [Burkholderiales bacterium]
MKALDTNILVRYYTQDDPRQAKIALRILKEEEALFVPRTVLIELYFVLRYGKQYHFEPAQINAVLQHLVGLVNVTIEQADAMETALRYHQQGIGFADALHLASSQHCSALLTFDDRKFARRARQLGLKPPVTVPSA